ncbi:hypothetical protein OG984_12480 [Nocardioides sp. NBC_00368]
MTARSAERLTPKIAPVASTGAISHFRSDGQCRHDISEATPSRIRSIP